MNRIEFLQHDSLKDVTSDKVYEIQTTAAVETTVQFWQGILQGPENSGLRKGLTEWLSIFTVSRNTLDADLDITVTNTLEKLVTSKMTVRMLGIIVNWTMKLLESDITETDYAEKFNTYVKFRANHMIANRILQDAPSFNSTSPIMNLKAMYEHQTNIELYKNLFLPLEIATTSSQFDSFLAIPKKFPS